MEDEAVRAKAIQVFEDALATTSAQYLPVEAIDMDCCLTTPTGVSVVIARFHVEVDGTVTRVPLSPHAE